MITDQLPDENVQFQDIGLKSTTYGGKNAIKVNDSISFYKEMLLW